MTTIVDESLMSIVKPDTVSGLDLEIEAGRSNIDGVITDHGFTTLTMAASTTNYIFIDVDTIIKSNTTGFPQGSIPIAEAVTDVSSVTSITDKRAFLSTGNNGLIATDKKREIFTWTIHGSLPSAKILADNHRFVPADCTIINVYMGLKKTGVGGSTIVDINRHDAPGVPTPGVPYAPGAAGTVYSTQANRPALPATGGTASAILAVLPDVTSLSKGDGLSIDIDQKASGGPKDLTIEVEVEYN